MANLQNDLSMNFHALGVGVGYYKNLNDLLATVNDVTLLCGALLDPERCGYRRENVQKLIAKDATVPRMRAELERLSWVSGPGSTVTIFFSGHGYRAPSGASAGYLCLHEADIDHLDDTALSAVDFSRAIHALRAERVVVILDCCHANSTAQIKSPGGALWKSGLPDAYFESLGESGGGRVVIASCRDEEKSYVFPPDDPRGDYSYFTYHFVNALRAKAGEDRLVRIGDVFQKTVEAVRSDTRQAHLIQTPVCKSEITDNFPIAYDHVGPQQADGDAGAAQPATQPPAPQPRSVFHIHGPNTGQQAIADTVQGDIVFNVGKPHSGDAK